MNLQKAVEPIVQQHLGDTFPACGLCVISRGETVLNAGWGRIDPDQEENNRNRIDKTRMFDLASVTKLFTTTAFLFYVSAGMVAIDDPLVKLVPEFGAINPRLIDGGQDPHSKERQPVDPAYQGQTVDPTRVTFRHLLTHTSGLPAWRDVFNAAGKAPPPPNELDPVPREVRWKRALEALCTYPFVGRPDGKTVRYSDIGLMLLGEAVARLHPSGKLDEAISQWVFRKIDFGYPNYYWFYGVKFRPIYSKHADFYATVPTEEDTTWRKRRVWGEVHDENACGVGGVAGHAGIFATPPCLAAFGDHWLSKAWRFKIHPDIWREAISEQVEYEGVRRGLGFMLKARENSMAGDLMSPNAFGHSGFTGTSLWIDPDRDLVVALLTNRVYPGRWHEGAHGGILGFRRAMHDAIVRECDG